ncbi:hypothetical protein CspHIS471_0408680 [Cutaneotrichosporon sp. HIS471]|nr:hypothetical protein CspHIS471_0408680 [Cutaneotrichosporon sp. HIS471]
MSVRPEEAQAYELPEIGRSPKLDALDDDAEQLPLLDDEDKRSSVDSDDSGLGFVQAAHEDELVNSTEIDALIARSVPSIDDPTLPTLTLRVIVLGSCFCIMGAAASTVFYFKSNAPSFSSYFVILATYPLGHALASERLVSRHKTLFGVDLNPGPFSVKEAILISVLSSSGAMSAYAADILAMLDLYYKAPLATIPSIILLLTTQCIGFGLAGMLYNLLVARPAMYWPSTLVVVQLFTTLYDTAATNKAARKLTNRRLHVFLAVFIFTFLWQFLPFLFFPMLTSVAVLCLVNNENWWMRTFGGAYTGLGMLDFSFDWSSIGTSGPLFTPPWALANWFAGLIGMIWVIVPLMLFFNFWDAREFPSPLSSGLYNATYHRFDVPSVLNPDLSFNDEAWETAAPLLLTPYFAVTYGLSFAALSSILVHVWIWHRDEIKEALTNRAPMNDVHNTLMRNYLPVPQWWYIAMLGINFVAAVLMVMSAPLQTPIWALVLSLAIAAVFLVPIGVVAAVSNTQIGLNVITEFVAGFLMPGKPIGNVTFKCFGYMAMSQALQLITDLILGWYTSIPPREMFLVQTIGTVLGALTNYMTLLSVLSSKRPFLDGTTPDPTGQWTGRRPGIFYSASIIWGAVSPRRFFAGKYWVLYLGFPFGAILPFMLWLAHKRWPGMKINKVCVPVVLSAAILLPEYPSNIILTGGITAFAVNGWIAKQYPKLHGQFVYVISSGLDAGTSITALAIYFLFSVLTQWTAPNWYGNSAIDSEHCKPGS